MKKLLLHICCGPCSTPVISNLSPEFEVAGFYYNPNIFPETEFVSRLDSAKKVAQFNGIKLIVPDHSAVIPAEAGIYINKSRGLDSRFCGNDEKERGNNKRGWKNSNDYESYLRFIGGTKQKPERCFLCYRQRLEKTAGFAKKNGFDAFSTTLLISPFQFHEELKKIGEEIAKEYGIDFHYQDFRALYKESREISKELGLYLQKYCGCRFSRRRK